MNFKTFIKLPFSEQKRAKHVQLFGHLQRDCFVQKDN